METAKNADQIPRLPERLHRRIEPLLSLLARQGSVIATYRNVGGRRHGPYYAIRYRTAGGRSANIYLSCDPGLAQRVGRWLASIQSQRRRQIEHRRLRRELGRAYRDSLARFDTELRRVGLTRKGSEIRGWRSGCAVQSRLSPLPAAAHDGRALTRGHSDPIAGPDGRHGAAVPPAEPEADRENGRHGEASAPA